MVHVSDRRPPAGDELEMLRDRLADTERALAALPEEALEEPAARAPRPPEEVVAEVLALLDRREALTARDEEVRRELARYAGFGEFDLDEVRGLERRRRARRGCVWRRPGSIRLHRTAPCSSSSAGPATRVLHPDGSRRLAERRAGPRLRAMTSSRGRTGRCRRIRDELAATAPRRERDGRRLAVLAAARDEVASLARATADATALRGGPRRHGRGRRALRALRLPAGAEQDAVRSAAAAHGWGILLDDPQPGEDVPILLRQSRWVRPISTVLDFLHIYPGYWETTPAG